MMKQQVSHRLSTDPAAPQYTNLNEIAQRFDLLCGWHAAVTEKLRELHHLEVQFVTPVKWRDLESQVVSLRFEIESFKEIF